MNPARELIDEYIEGTITPERLATLEGMLAADAELRRYFVRYCGLNTDLHLHVKSASAAERALSAILPKKPEPVRRWPKLAAVAGGFLAILLLGGWLLRPRPVPPSPIIPVSEDIAWLVNAQNCEWDDRQPIKEGLKPGTTLAMNRGLAEIRFKSGATVILSGPCRLELTNGNAAKLLQGKIAARVPESAIGFELLTPQGKVIDLGTEFGVSVGESGAADVFVFEGQVDAYSPAGQKLNLTKKQGATLAGGDPVRRDNANGDYTRKIVPNPVVRPNRWRWEFAEGKPGTLLDRNGHGIGLTDRLPGTGQSYPGRDPNLCIVPGSGLELTTTNSDINGQAGMPRGEYFGIPLSKFGFTGTEDFEIVVEIPNIPTLKRVGQFGLYAGNKSNRNIRGGLIAQNNGEYRQFLVNNSKWMDHDSGYLGLSSTGDDLRMILKRNAGKYTLTVDNQTSGLATTLAIKHPDFLDAEKDLHVGIFGANTQSNEPKTLLIRSVTVTVWTVGK
ncbi:FecR domain-containing protein [Zavarzinella formosa]|uniref:FecR domain-containing protein n=1 Tax=Zavarzinella formosa TaxID=360055 RepID=UPI00031B3D36|nr:FecR domain-containing protein [Zavarzinella formosa]